MMKIPRQAAHAYAADTYQINPFNVLQFHFFQLKKPYPAYRGGQVKIKH